MSSVSIILPTRNNEDHIGELLSSIFSQSFKGELRVLILDSSDDLTPHIASKYSKKGDLRIVRVEPEDYNYGGTRNYGALLTQGEYIIFISTDVYIRDEFWLTKLTAPLKNSLVAGVYGRQLPKEGAPPMEEFFIKFTYPEDEKKYFLGNNEKISDFFFSNTNSAIRRDVWEKIPLPEMLKSEDQEWAKRALLAGYKIVYEPRAIVYHSHHYTLKQVFQEYFDSGATMPYVYNNDRISPPSFLKRGLEYEIAQLRYLKENKYWKYVPYSFLYDFIKFLGYFFGTKYKYIPTRYKKVLCKKSNHWDKYNDAVPLARSGILRREMSK